MECALLQRSSDFQSKLVNIQKEKKQHLIRSRKLPSGKRLTGRFENCNIGVSISPGQMKIASRNRQIREIKLKCSTLLGKYKGSKVWFELSGYFKN